MRLGKAPIVEIGISVIVQRVTTDKSALFEQANNLMQEDILLVVFNDDQTIEHDNALVRLDKNDLIGLMVFVVRDFDKTLDQLGRESFEKCKILDLLCKIGVHVAFISQIRPLLIQMQKDHLVKLGIRQTSNMRHEPAFFGKEIRECKHGQLVSILCP